MPWVTPAYADACFAPSYASARGKFLLAADRAGARLDVLVNAEARAPNGGTLTTDVAVLGPPEAEEGCRQAAEQCPVSAIQIQEN